jgi:hypothetical protein
MSSTNPQFSGVTFSIFSAHGILGNLATRILDKKMACTGTPGQPKYGQQKDQAHE